MTLGEGMTPAGKAFATWWFKVCSHQDIIKQDPQRAYRCIAKLAFVAGTKWMGEELGVEQAMNDPDYKLWSIITRFTEDLVHYTAEQTGDGDSVAAFDKVNAELKEKIQEGIRLSEEKTAAEKEANMPGKIQRGTFILGTTTHEKLYSELADAVKDLLHVTRTKDEVSIDMMKPLSRLSRLVEGEAKESERSNAADGA